MLVVLNIACGFADFLHNPSSALFPPGDRGCRGIVLGGNSLDHPLVLPGQNKDLAIVMGDDVTSPHSTFINKTLPLPHCKCMKTISIVITWFANLTRFAVVASEGSDSVHLVVVKMLTCGHAIIEIVHVQSMPFRYILWRKQRCYRLFETLRHAVVHVDVPAVLRLGIRQDVGLDSILDGLVLVVHPERQPTSPLYHTFVDGDMLAEVVERLPSSVSRSYTGLILYSLSSSRFTGRSSLLLKWRYCLI